MVFSTPATTASSFRLLRPDFQELFNVVRTTFDSGPLTLPLTGTYTIEIWRAHPPFLTSDQGAIPSACSMPTAAPEIFVDQQVDGTIDPRAGAVLFRFTGTAGQEVFFDSLAGGIGGGWTLFGLDDEPINFLTSLQTDFQVTIPTDGTYILALTGSNQGTTPFHSPSSWYRRRPAAAGSTSARPSPTRSSRTPIEGICLQRHGGPARLLTRCATPRPGRHGR